MIAKRKETGLRNAWSREPQWAPAACLFSRPFKRLFKGLLLGKALLPRRLSKLREWWRFTHGKPARRNALRCGTGKPPIEQNSPNQPARRVSLHFQFGASSTLRLGMPYIIDIDRL